MGECKVTQKLTRKERIANDWHEAEQEYGHDEAVYICSEKWGLSTYRTLEEIKKIEEDLWL